MTQNHDAAPAAARTATRTTVRRAEKLTALAALLGPETMERLRQQDPGFANGSVRVTDTSDAQVARERDRLLDRLRARWPEAAGDGQGRGVADAPVDRAPDGSGMPAAVDTRIAAAVDMARLADEHPAVILHVLERMDRKTRVAALRALPGPIARAALRRLRSG